MIFFRRLKPTDEISISESEIMSEFGSLLDRSSRSVGSMLDQFRADEVSLEERIRDLTEQLRQTRVAITAFEAAGAILTGGREGASAVDPPARSNLGRLVPRQVPERKDIQA
ncbi:hypothetical protein [Mesorhizobium sp. 128a]